MKNIILLASIFSSIFAQNANASIPKQNYLGGAFGVSQHTELDNITPNSDTSGTSYSIYGGYMFNRIVGIETSYTKYGDITSNGNKYMSPKSIAASANLGYSFDNGFRPFALVGLSYVETEPSLHNSISSDSGAGFHLGFGVEYSPIEQLTLRVVSQADSLSVDKVSTTSTNQHTIGFSSVQLGASYNF